MATVIALMPVDDFTTWHAEYERMHDTRAEFGEQGRRLYRDEDDPNHVVVVFEWDTHDNARRYFTSPELTASVDRANALARPRVLYVTAT